MSKFSEAKLKKMIIATMIEHMKWATESGDYEGIPEGFVRSQMSQIKQWANDMYSAYEEDEELDDLLNAERDWFDEYMDYSCLDQYMVEEEEEPSQYKRIIIPDDSKESSESESSED